MVELGFRKVKRSLIQARSYTSCPKESLTSKESIHDSCLCRSLHAEDHRSWIEESARSTTGLEASALPPKIMEADVSCVLH